MPFKRFGQTAALLSVVFGLGSLSRIARAAGEPPASLPSIEFALEPSEPIAVVVPAPSERRLRSVLISINDPDRIAPGLSIAARLEVLDPRCATGPTLTKSLHGGDPDVLWSIRQPRDIALRITITSPPRLEAAALAFKPLGVAIRVAELAEADSSVEGVAFEAEPNDNPGSANGLTLGQTVYGLADDRPYLPFGNEMTDAERTAGADWFTFTFESEVPKLAFFALDFVDRDVPPDLRIYRKENGRIVEYTRGIDPQSSQRERPPRMGANKFTTRVLTKGTYFVWVDACQPEYQLRTKLFDVPPYLKPEEAEHADPATIAAAARRAIRTAMDFQLLAGDSWHANTPRKGHPLDRVANFHHETSTCVACHPTHFTTQSALAAVKAGYEIEQPFAMQFLTERLANNPVPFHCHPQALWARMIPAPANVLGRLSTMVMDYENLITGSPRNNLHQGIAEFLKLYYDGRTALPPDESNGNNPVSRYKVAADSWRQLDEIFRRTGEPGDRATRDLVARLLPTGKPAHTRDLAAQTIGLSLIDPKHEKHAELIGANVKQLLSLQRASGHWSVKFDPNYPITEMQTGESLYALDSAGLEPDDPAMRRGIAALLGRQQAFGGWFDVNPYEQFRTPFRETQWALMSLASIYPNVRTRQRGWNGPLGRQTVALCAANAPGRLIGDLEKIWDAPAADLQRQMVAQFLHESPLVRMAACRALGRVGDEAAIAGLARCLGDETKVVRRAAAEALRLMGNRVNGSRRPGESPVQVRLVAELSKALRSPDDRTRRGATRVFAAHFRELSQENALVGPLLALCGDRDPVVAMQAIKGLWRWWYWRADLGLRNRIEDYLIAGLAQPRHPWVRRNLIEGLYIIGDDNIRYLYQQWIPALARADSRRLATEGQHDTVNRLGAKYIAALERGNRLQREGVLRAMSEFFERPVLGGRIGNDLEPMLFYDGTVSKIESALTARMTDPDPEIRRLALEALVTIRGDRSPDLARAVARRLGDPDGPVRTWATTMMKTFPLKVSRAESDSATLALIDELSAQPVPDAQAAALALIGRLGPISGAGPSTDLTAKVVMQLSAKSAVVRAAAMNALRSFPSRWSEKPVHEAIERGLGDEDPQVRAASVRLALEPKAKVAEAALRTALDDPAPAARIAILERIASEVALKKDLRLLGVVSNSLVDEHGGVCEKALQLIQAQPALVANAAIEDGLRELVHSPKTADRQRDIATALLATRGRSSSGSGDARERLDLAYFKAKILPIFNHLGDDGQNCMGCHRSHTILKMVAPSKDGVWTTAAVRDNYRAALRVVNLANPAESLLLGKPTWEAAEEAEAQSDPSKKAHAGGVRFEKNSREYQTLLDWINGARLPGGKKNAAR